jgi:hypothetical protein
VKPFFVHRKGEALLNQDGLTLATLPEEFQKTFAELSPKYIDSLSLLAGIAAQRALGSTATRDGKDFGVIVGSAFGAIDSTVDFDAQALAKGPNAVNPMDFPNTVANAAGSRIGIWLQLKGPNVTLTNGETSFIDAMGFAFEGHDCGLFERCLVGAVEKVPESLKPLADSLKSAEWREGACLFLASGDPAGDFLFEVQDYFSLQLKPDLSLSGGFLERFETLLKGVEWLGYPEGTPLEVHFPKLNRYRPSAVLEMGLGGLESMNRFLSASEFCGVIGTFSKAERKCSFIKLNKKKRSC